MSTKTDMLERIADAIDGGGDFGQGTVNEVGYLERIAKYLEEHGCSSSGGSGDSNFVIINALFDDGAVTLDKTYSEIAEIIDAGKIPFINASGSTYMLTSYDSNSQVIRFGSAIMYGTGTTAYATDIYINGDGAYVTFMNITVSAGGGD